MEQAAKTISEYPISELGLDNFLVRLAEFDHERLRANVALSAQALAGQHLLIVSPRVSGGCLAFLCHFDCQDSIFVAASMMTAQIVNAMNEKSLSLGDIMAELNKKYLDSWQGALSLAGVFCEHDATRQTLRVANLGMLDCYVGMGAELSSVVGSYTRLGQAPLTPENLDIHSWPINEVDRFISWFDNNAEFDARCSVDELSEQLATAPGADTSIANAVFDSRAGSDSASYIELFDFAHAQALRAEKRQLLDEAANDEPVMADWEFTHTIKGRSLAVSNPVPLVMDLLQQHHVPAESGADVFTILTELYTNALDHAVLNMDTALKYGSDGSNAYLKERARRLKTVQDGSIVIHCACQMAAGRWQLSIEVSDSGAGYDLQQALRAAHGDGAATGRGLTIVNDLADSLEYSNSNGCITACYSW